MAKKKIKRRVLPKSVREARRLAKNRKIKSATLDNILSGEFKTSFVSGNDWWKRRAKHGVDALFTSPTKLLEGFEQYITEMSENPIIVDEIKVVDGMVERVPVYKQRPLTIGGLCIFLGVNEVYLAQFKNTKTYKENPDFPKVMSIIDQVTRTQKFEGASVGLFNANIIARDLGLRENVDNTSKGEALASPLIVNQYNTAPPMAGSEDEVEDNLKKKSK